LREVSKAAELLEKDYQISANIWSVTSFNELRKDGLAVERHNRLHPEEKPKKAFVEEMLADNSGPIVAATDYMRIYADQIRPFVNSRFVSLGTDGYGRSDTRQKLRHFFEVDAKFIVVAALHALALDGTIKNSVVSDAIKRYGIDPEKLDPVTI